MSAQMDWSQVQRTRSAAPDTPAGSPVRRMRRRCCTGAPSGPGSSSTMKSRNSSSCAPPPPPLDAALKSTTRGVLLGGPRWPGQKASR